MIPYEPIGLAEAIVKKAQSANDSTESSTNHLDAKNTSALAAWMLAKAAPTYPEASAERTAIIAAVGYLLVNIRASHQTYLHPVVFPFGKLDLELLDKAEEMYEALASNLIRKNPNALAHVRPMTGTVQIHIRGESGHYETIQNSPTSHGQPVPWEGNWAGYPLK